jgi:hypothetical protein
MAEWTKGSKNPYFRGLHSKTARIGYQTPEQRKEGEKEKRFP